MSAAVGRVALLHRPGAGHGDGRRVVVEAGHPRRRPAAADELTDVLGHTVARITFAASTALCTTGSLGQPGAYGLGTRGGPTERLALLAGAGFADPVVAADTGLDLVLAATRPQD